RRGREAGRGGGAARPGAGEGRRGVDGDPGRGRRVERPRGAGPAHHRAAAADREGGGERPAGRDRQHPEWCGRPRRDGGRAGRPGSGHFGLGEARPVWRAGSAVHFGQEGAAPGVTEPDFVTRTRESYDAAADQYAEWIADELVAKPFDRAMLSAF